MSYRTHLHKIKKSYGDSIKDLTYPELVKKYGHDIEDVDDKWIGRWNLFPKTSFELGHFVHDKIEKDLKPFFTQEDTKEYFSGESPIWLIDKDVLAIIIEAYREQTYNIYSEINSKLKYMYDRIKSGKVIDIEELDKQGGYFTIDEMLIHMDSKASIWGAKYITPYNLKEEPDKLTNTNKFEYDIFDLVKIYREFNEDEHYLLISGG